MLLYVDSQFSSPYAMSAFVALRVKGMAFDIQPLDLAAGETTSAPFAAASLTSRVPTLTCDGFSLSESTAIVEYLEEIQPRPRLFPEDIESRARARQVQAWLRSDLLALRQDRSTEVIFYGPTQAPLSVDGQAAADKLIRAASHLLSHGGNHLFGEWCIADTDLALMLHRLILNNDPVPTRLIDYAREQWQLPAVQEWVRLQRPPR